MTYNASSKLELSFPSDREVTMTRHFNAPRQLVFEACSKPEHMKQWFGPRGWTLVVCEMDMRPGGKYRWVLRGPDGTEMGMGGVCHSVTPPETWTVTEVFDDWPDHESIVTGVLEEHDGVTTLRTTVRYPSADVRDAVIASGMADGAGSSYDRLEEYLQASA